MKHALSGIWLFCTLLVTSGTQAAEMGLQPGTSGVALGSSVQFAVTITGLGDGSAPSLASYDVQLAFDPAVLSFASLAFGDPLLGDQLDLLGLGSTTLVDTATAGVIGAFELSFDDENTLNTLQSSAFTLLHVTFDAIAAALNTPIEIVILDLASASGGSITATTSGASVTITAAPAPATSLLLAAGCVLLWPFRRGLRASGALANPGVA